MRLRQNSVIRAREGSGYPQPAHYLWIDDILATGGFVMSNDAHDARAIANEILVYARSQGLPLTIMQVLKLTYLVQGWGLALLDKRIVKQDVQAWQYGPVYADVYRSFVGNGSAPINSFAQDRVTGATYRASLNSDEEKILRTVVNSYGRMHAFQLSNIMHQAGTPWTETYNSSGSYSVIPVELIKKHFDKLKADRNVKVA